MLKYLTISFIILGSGFNAVTDVLDHHYSDSVFSEYNEQYWNPAVSWTNKYIDGDKSQGRKQWHIIFFNLPIPVVWSDAWHLFKMLWIVMMLLAIAINLSKEFWEKVYWFFLLGILWNAVFELFYSKILRKE